VGWSAARALHPEILRVSESDKVPQSSLCAQRHASSGAHCGCLGSPGSPPSPALPAALTVAPTEALAPRQPLPYSMHHLWRSRCRAQPPRLLVHTQGRHLRTHHAPKTEKLMGPWKPRARGLRSGTHTNTHTQHARATRSGLTTWGAALGLESMGCVACRATPACLAMRRCSLQPRHARTPRPHLPWSPTTTMRTTSWGGGTMVGAERVRPCACQPALPPCMPVTQWVLSMCAPAPAGAHTLVLALACHMGVAERVRARPCLHQPLPHPR